MAGTTAIGGYPVSDNGDNLNNIGAAVAGSIAALEKAALNVFNTAAARNAKITSTNAVVGMYSVILSPSVHTEKLQAINGDGTLTWVPSDVQIVGSKAQQSSVTPTPGALLYRSDINVLSVADQAGGTFWAIGHGGQPTKLEKSGVGTAPVVDGVAASTSPNYFRLSAYDFTVTPTRDGYAFLSTVSLGGTAPARTDGGSAAGWVSAKIVHSRDNVLLSPFGSFADVVINEGGEAYKPWSCPQPVYLREGQATTFSVAVQLGAAGGAFRMSDFRTVLFQL